jgi:hypothetical protein
MKLPLEVTGVPYGTFGAEIAATAHESQSAGCSRNILGLRDRPSPPHVRHSRPLS